MNGNSRVADTNILLYIITGHKSLSPFKNDYLFISEITEIELLGYKNISELDYSIRFGLLDSCTLININAAIKKITISFRQNFTIKIPDAIIAATSIYMNIPLLTADKDFRKINELNHYCPTKNSIKIPTLQSRQWFEAKNRLHKM